jgi:hypothetical protein
VDVEVHLQLILKVARTILRQVKKNLAQLLRPIPGEEVAEEDVSRPKNNSGNRN